MSFYCFLQQTDKAESAHINLKVQGQDGSVVHFKIKRNTPLRKLMNAYCERTGVRQPQVRFQFDGTRLNDTDTPIKVIFLLSRSYSLTFMCLFLTAGHGRWRRNRSLSKSNWRSLSQNIPYHSLTLK